MSVPSRTIFIGVPSALAREAFRSVRDNCTLVGVVESRPSTWMARRGVERHLSGMTLSAKRLGIEYLLLAERHQPRESLVQWLRRLRPDLICVAGMTRLLRVEELVIPRMGALNLHPSLLPKYRGPDPYYWQYHQGDLAGGLTVHRVTEGIDAGNILGQSPVDIGLGEPLEKMTGRLAAAGGVLLAQVLQRLSAGEVEEKPQAHLACPQFASLVPRGTAPAGWLDWPLDRAWHFLRGTHHAHPFLPLPITEQSQWRIGDRRAFSGVGDGGVHQEPRGVFVDHPAGRIELLPPLKWTLFRRFQAYRMKRVEYSQWLQ